MAHMVTTVGQWEWHRLLVVVGSGAGVKVIQLLSE